MYILQTLFALIGIVIAIQLHNIVIELRWANRMKEKELNIYQKDNG